MPSLPPGLREGDHIGVALRPLGSSLPLGLAGLAAASIVLSGHELGWISQTQRTTVGVLVLCAGAALQAVSSVLAFAARDGAAGSTLGTLASGWAATGIVFIVTAPGSTNGALGTLQLALGGMVLLFSTSVAASKLVPSLAVALAAVRFLTSGLYQVSANTTWEHVSGVIGLAVFGIAAYAAWALELEDARHRRVLPVGRRPTPNEPAREPGIRASL